MATVTVDYKAGSAGIVLAGATVCDVRAGSPSEENVKVGWIISSINGTAISDPDTVPQVLKAALASDCTVTFLTGEPEAKAEVKSEAKAEPKEDEKIAAEEPEEPKEEIETITTTFPPGQKIGMSVLNNIVSSITPGSLAAEAGVLKMMTILSVSGQKSTSDAVALIQALHADGKDAEVVFASASGVEEKAPKGEEKLVIEEKEEVKTVTFTVKFEGEVGMSVLDGVVRKVTPGSPAYEANVKYGMKILKINDQVFSEALLKSSSSQGVNIEFEATPQMMEEPNPPYVPEPEKKEVKEDKVEVVETKETGESVAYPVRRVTPGSPAEEANVKYGMKIISIDGQPYTPSLLLSKATKPCEIVFEATPEMLEDKKEKTTDTKEIKTVAPESKPLSDPKTQPKAAQSEKKGVTKSRTLSIESPKEAMDVFRAPITVTKYNEHNLRTSSKKMWVNVDDGVGSIMYKGGVLSPRARKISLADVKEVRRGKQTPVFLRFQSRSASEANCFSVVTKNGRTINVEAGDSNTAEKWTQALRVMAAKAVESSGDN
ncbi:hypothetical protein AAMO2058_000299900 [Amorphochlora amoebiformis]